MAIRLKDFVLMYFKQIHVCLSGFKPLQFVQEVVMPTSASTAAADLSNESNLVQQLENNVDAEGMVQELLGEDTDDGEGDAEEEDAPDGVDDNQEEEEEEDFDDNIVENFELDIDGGGEHAEESSPLESADEQDDTDDDDDEDDSRGNRASAVATSSSAASDSDGDDASDAAVTTANTSAASPDQIDTLRRRASPVGGPLQQSQLPPERITSPPFLLRMPVTTPATTSANALHPQSNCSNSAILMNRYVMLFSMLSTPL